MAGNFGIRKWKWVFFFLAPSLVGLLLFIVFPIFSSLWLAFQLESDFRAALHRAGELR